MATFQSAIHGEEELEGLIFSQQTNEKHRKNMCKSQSAKGFR